MSDSVHPGSPAARLRAILGDMPPELAPPAPDSPPGRIQAATRELFAQSGLDGVSVRAVAGTAGVNQAMISYYFGSKEQLVDQVITQELLNIMGDVLAGLDSDAAPREVIAGFPLRILAALRADPLRLQLLRLTLATEPDRLRRIIRSLGDHSILGVSRVMADLIGEAQAAGHLVGVSPRSILLFLIANAYGLVFMEPIAREVMGFSLADESAWLDHKSGLAELIGNGIFAKPDEGEVEHA